MAKIKYTPGIDSITGAFSKDGIVQRQKHIRGPKGDVTKTCRLEAYIVRKPRNWDNIPARPAEHAHQMAFGDASKQANALIRAIKTQTATPEQKAQYDELVTRFYRQLNGTPDPNAPRDTKGIAKIYGAFNCFVRSIIYYDALNS